MSLNYISLWSETLTIYNVAKLKIHTQEAMWLNQSIKSYKNSLKKEINVGSSAKKFREQDQQPISFYIFNLLKKLKIQTYHLDFKI